MGKRNCARVSGRAIVLRNVKEEDVLGYMAMTPVNFFDSDKDARDRHQL
jgi:hypothetical protein